MRYFKIVLVLLAMSITNANAERIKDLASITGVRSNQLVGYGVVVGLNGTGDKVKSGDFTSQSLISLSFEAEIISLFLALNFTEVTPALWPAYFFRTLLFLKFQS